MIVEQLPERVVPQTITGDEFRSAVANLQSSRILTPTLNKG
jgi:hypothetical protein